MRPVRLEVQGFTAFREAVTVDFEGRRLFAITGPTGAGKSSLLDAVTWALYGEVPRVGRSTQQLISHHAPSMSVRFEFDSRGRRYRIARIARGSGSAAVRLERLHADGHWEPLTDRVRETNEEVGRILGLDYHTFTKTVLLPQGAFDSFMKGDRQERRKILGQLLGLEVYAQARSLAHERATRARDRAEMLHSQLQGMELADPQAIAALEAQRKELEASAARLAERRTTLSDLGDVARTEREAQRAAQEAARAAETAERERAEAERRLGEATRARDQAQARVESLQAERAALAYDPAAHEALRMRVKLLEVRERERRALETARAALAEAERAERLAATDAATATRAATDAAAEAARAARARDEAARALALAAAHAERAAGRLAAEATSAEEAQRRAEREAAEHEQRAARLDGVRRQIEALDRERAQAEQAAAGAAAEAATAEREAAEAAGRREQASEAAAGARGRLDALRVEHAAAMLQRAVQPGDPCPVCGRPVESVERHDAPDLDEAEEALREAERVLDEARAAAERAGEAAATATARSAAATREVESVARRRAEVIAEAGTEEADPAAIARSSEQARREAAEATARAQAERERAHASRGAADALRLRLAAVPREVAEAGRPEGDARDAADGGGEGTADALDAALAAYTQSADEARAAASAQGEAETASMLAAHRAGEARRACEQATRAVQDAERHLAEHEVDEDEEPQALREALEAADAQAQRSRELETAEGQARERLAAATASCEACASEAERARTEAGQRAAARQQAQTEAERAAKAFAGRWLTVIGEGDPSFDALKQIMLHHDHTERTTAEELGIVGERLEQARRAATEAERLRAEAAALEREGHLAGALALELQGNRFIAYVQQEAMGLLAAGASDHLAAFTGGRYTLVADEDEFAVVDRLNGDERRSVKTLSGGETFLASLALALTLSEQLPSLSGSGAAVSLESLFLDEGFGALDAESLDLAVQGLETLAGGRRMIGVISHVPELAERLPERIDVVRNGNSSTVQG